MISATDICLALRASLNPPFAPRIVVNKPARAKTESTLLTVGNGNWVASAMA
jgi:hypothetical protein